MSDWSKEWYPRELAVCRPRRWLRFVLVAVLIAMFAAPALADDFACKPDVALWFIWLAVFGAVSVVTLLVWLLLALFVTTFADGEEQCSTD